MAEFVSLSNHKLRVIIVSRMSMMTFFCFSFITKMMIVRLPAKDSYPLLLVIFGSAKLSKL